MTRNLTAAMQAAITQDVIRPCYFLEMEFSGGTERITTFHRDVTFLGENWSSTSWLLSIKEVKETEDTQPVSCALTFGGEDPAFMELILDESFQNNRWTLHFALLNSNDYAILDPYIIFKGFFDSAEINSDGFKTTIDVNLENDLSRMQRVNEVRYTHESQQALFSGDLGFFYVAKIAEWHGFWGKASRLRATRKRKSGNGRN